MAFPLDERFVTETEAKLGRTLPQSYVFRMRRQNGGAVEVSTDVFQLYPILDTSDRKRLARTCNDIIRETAQARKWSEFPPEAIAIGDNGCGDKLVFLADPHEPRFAETVYWWDHETGELNLAAVMFEELRSRDK